MIQLSNKIWEYAKDSGFVHSTKTNTIPCIIFNFSDLYQKKMFVGNLNQHGLVHGKNQFEFTLCLEKILLQIYNVKNTKLIGKQFTKLWQLDNEDNFVPSTEDLSLIDNSCDVRFVYQ